MEKEKSIQETCNYLNNEIHNKLFKINHLNSETEYVKAFTSLDVIDDCQNAIEEFENITGNSIQERSTLYIYGVLQALYCQQDGLFHLYKAISNVQMKNCYELFNEFNFAHEIREVRDDIAGHPTNRKNGKEHYFIAKGSNTKDKFTYIGYTPAFRKVDVDLKSFISEQNKFTRTILNEIEKTIKRKIQMHKDEFKTLKLIDYTVSFHRSVQLVNRGINDATRSFQFETGINDITKNLESLLVELNKRYNNATPPTLLEIIRLINYIISKFNSWHINNELLFNPDAEIFMDSFGNQIYLLTETLTEVDNEFSS